MNEATATRTNTEAHVCAVNKVNARANKLALELQTILAPLVGKKVLKADGHLVKKYAGLFTEFMNDDLQIFQYTSRYSMNNEIEFMVKGCETGRHGNYHVTYVYAGKCDNDGVLTEVCEPCTDRRTDWTVAEVDAARRAIDKADQALRDAKSSLGPFDRYDR